MLENLNIKNTEEKTETVYTVTATFTFTDKELEDSSTKAFYDMLKPKEEEEITPSTEALVTDYPYTG